MRRVFISFSSSGNDCVKLVSELVIFCMQRKGGGNVVYHTIIHFVKGHNKESKGLLYD